VPSPARWVRAGALQPATAAAAAAGSAAWPENRRIPPRSTLLEGGIREDLGGSERRRGRDGGRGRSPLAGASVPNTGRTSYPGRWDPGCSAVSRAPHRPRRWPQAVGRRTKRRGAVRAACAHATRRGARQAVRRRAGRSKQPPPPSPCPPPHPLPSRRATRASHLCARRCWARS
jgi:hypothetical protein